MTSQEEIFCYKKRKRGGKEMNHQVVDLKRKKKRGLEREWERGCNWKHQ